MRITPQAADIRAATDSDERDGLTTIHIPLCLLLIFEFPHISPFIPSDPLGHELHLDCTISLHSRMLN
jgi:hypothetical protein